ncbi:Zn(II)2Cys6 transcription factor [Aspergillus vadensis CBS 113365]|uniref:Zn(2)-C6 fungal-type domain-containing protein n=1 Tax=Aspergillus vadensis (strain CBS 113365 / IMI 142717 / IBT 24658) TaxID=1448311 RepID=A0A319B767_ASPVC|nr:hypothetical protein BO88DRAFT_426440 [Aspergillus vadensis CBS 113365]PYH68345.1 hypothetical protein BO88DRAFT_426440 [Aspergillus vadensis CBS 113365]
MKRVLDEPSEKLICPFCGGAYLRRDVLRRHLQRCGHKGDYQPPIQGKPGRKRKSCNACATARVSCDGDLPCEACLQKGLNCSFSRTHEQSPRYPQASQGTTGQLPDDINPSTERDPCQGPAKLSIPFLLHYTNVENESKYESLRLLSQCTGADPQVGCCAVDHHQPGNSYFLTDPWERLFHSFICTANLDPPCDSQSSAIYSFAHADLESTSAELLGLLACSEHQDALGQEILGIDTTRQLFTPVNIAKFIKAFFDNPFHTHYINSAAFSLNKASNLLALTMVLLGAVYSNPYRSDDLTTYSNITEHLIFEGSAFKKLLQGNRDILNSRGTLETLQAAMLVVILQSYKENPDSIRRIRLQRMPTIFTVIRMLDLNKITNDCIPGVSDWDTYLHRESLVRVMAGIYLLDCYCVIFFRYPTLLRLDEIAFEIPQRDDLFHAHNAAEWEELSSKDQKPYEPLRLRTVLRDFMRPEGQPPQRGQYFPNTIFGSFLVVSAIQCVLFDLLALHTFMDDIRVFEPVERALNRWKTHWDSMCQGIEPSTARRAGFIIHAAEFWCVAKALVKHPSAAWPEDSKDTLDTTQSFRRLVDRLMADDDTAKVV